MFRELARINKKISMEECEEILKNEKRGVLSVIGDNGYPYGMPMNHFYNEEDGKIYFHCGKTGHRLDALKKDNKVSFCVYDKGCKKQGEWALNVKRLYNKCWGVQQIELEKKLKKLKKSRAYLFKILYNGIVQKPEQEEQICSTIILQQI